MPDQARQAVDLLLFARWVVPIVPADTVLDHYGVAVLNERIVAICPRNEALQRFAPARQVELPEHVLMPGLVNAHGHAPMSLLKGMANDKPLQDWLQQDIWPTEKRWVNAEFVYDGAQLAIAEMLLSGTTCFSDMYFFPEAVAEASRQAGLRAQLAFPVLDFPTVWGSGPDHYISMGTALFDQYKNSSLVHIAFGPHAPYTISTQQLERIAMLSEELQAGVQMHVHETAGEIEQAIQLNGQRPLRMLRDIGLLNPRMQCVHACHLNDDDIEDLALTASHVVHCPDSNLKLASGMCPVVRLDAAGINVALGTDGSASNNDLDLFSELRSAALLAKGVSGDATALPAFKALEMATINGARALGLDEQIGSLEVGKLADMIAIDLDHLRLQPVYHPVSQLVYNQVSDRVSHVWVGGKSLLADGQLHTLDTEAVRAKALAWADKISGAKA
jgi:5-methylthioadenosine/S-adenosylhomocysteine deaminase